MQRTGQACPGNQKKKKKERKEKKKKKKMKKRQHPGKKKKRKKKRRRRKRQRLERTKKSNVLDKVHVQVHMGIFVIYLSNSSHSIFSPFWRELFGEHTWLQLTFFSPSSNQTLSKKFSLLILSHFFFFSSPQNPLYQTDLQC